MIRVWGEGEFLQNLLEPESHVLARKGIPGKKDSSGGQRDGTEGNVPASHVDDLGSVPGVTFTVP